MNIRCYGCKENLPEAQFFRDSTRKRGRNAYCRSCTRTRQRIAMRKHRLVIKLEVLTHYGGTPPTCACCGETLLEFLTIDHINGGGTRERMVSVVSVDGRTYTRWKWGSEIYFRLRRQGYPEGIQVLCMNCNWARRSHGGCPHQKPLNTEPAL